MLRQQNLIYVSYFYVPVLTRISEYVALVLCTIWVNVSNQHHKNVVSGSTVCCHNRDMAAKYADIWLSGRHVAVIGHDTGGKHVPAKMAQLAESQSLE